MAFKKIKKIKEDAACSILLKEPQELFIENISEFKQSTKQNAKPNQYYFYIDYVMQDDSKFGASYTIYFEGDSFKCGPSSKLYHLMKGILDLNPLVHKSLEFEPADIDDTLKNKKFLSSAIVQNFGGKNFPYIILEQEVNE